MKLIVTVAIFSIICFNVSAQNKITNSLKLDASKKVQVVESACGQCMFKMKADDCELAVRIDGKDYFVDGTKIDDHGDSHAKDGFCNAIRKTIVQGDIINNRFKVTYFSLIKDKKDK